MTRRNVYLAQVNNTFGENAFLPYSVGLIWAHCRRLPEIAAHYRLAEFLFLREPVEDCAARLEAPDVLGISCYIWNWKYSMALAAAVRARHPECLIVVGGPHVPTRADGFFCEHPAIDLAVHFEGEEAFADILTERLAAEPDYARIPGLSLPGADGEAVTTARRARVSDPNHIPSPYLEGLFDEVMTQPYAFHASQETHRGCPYSCSFCDWGSAVFTKLRPFADQRIADEIDWFARHRIELLYNCDANFGILKRDADVVEMMVAAKARHGFPQKFRAAYAKKSNDRIFDIARRLNEAGMSKGVTLSLQSVNDATLDAVKRRNIKVEDFTSLVGRYRAADIPTYTEIILGLPGETYDSFADGLDEVLRAGQHDGLNVYPCIMLPNSEMGDPAYRERYRIETRRMPIMLLHGTPPADGLREENDIVVATATMTVDDWRRMFVFAWAVQAFHCMGITQLPARLLAAEHGVSYRRFYEALLDAAAGRPGTLLHDELAAINSLLDRVLGGATWDIVMPEFGDISWPPEEATFLRTVTDKERFYDEFGAWFAAFAGALPRPLAPDLADDLVRYQRHLAVDPGPAREIAFPLAYDLPGYFSGDSEGGGVPARACTVTVRAEVAGPTLADFAREVVWYGRKGGRFRRTDVAVNHLGGGPRSLARKVG